MVFELKGHYSLLSKIKRLKKVIITIGWRFLTAKVAQVRKINYVVKILLKFINNKKE